MDPELYRNKLQWNCGGNSNIFIQKNMFKIVIARGTGFWSQNTKGVARGVLTEKARPEGWVFSQAQHPMIKTCYSMSLHCNTATTVLKLLL